MYKLSMIIDKYQKLSHIFLGETITEYKTTNLKIMLLNLLKMFISSNINMHVEEIKDLKNGT